MENSQIVLKMSIVDQIHEEFDQAFSDADLILKKHISDLNNELNNPTIKTIDYSDLSVNFRNSSTIVKLVSIKSDKSSLNREISKTSDLISKLNNIRLKYPYKIISYSQIITILEKYDLYIAPSENYTDILPEDNAKHLLNYKRSVSDKNINGNFDSKYPICSQKIKNNLSGLSHNRYDVPLQFYVCAPIKMFSTINRFIIGKELFYNSSLAPKFTYVKPTKIEDPIILSPLFLDNEIANDLKLFHVVTAWGPEAKDPLVFNQLSN